MIGPDGNSGAHPGSDPEIKGSGCGNRHAESVGKRNLKAVARSGLALAVVLLGACAQQAPMMRPPAPQSVVVLPPPPAEPAAEPDEDDPMGDVPGDRMLPALAAGVVERLDCKVGGDDLQARMAVEARGGQVVSFAYYSKWRPRTCSLDMQRDAPFTKWRLTTDGATRVQTYHGWFLIRARPDAWEFEFRDVERQQFCGMDGYTNGTMRISRGSTLKCSVAGLLDRDDELPVEFAGVPAPDGAGVAVNQPLRLACDEATGEFCGPDLYPAAATAGVLHRQPAGAGSSPLRRR